MGKEREEEVSVFYAVFGANVLAAGIACVANLGTDREGE